MAETSNIFKSLLSPFWKLWKDDEFMELVESLFALATADVMAVAGSTVDGVGVDTASDEGPARWEPLYLILASGAPAPYKVGAVDIGGFRLGDSPDQGKLWWPMGDDITFDGVSDAPVNAGVVTDFELSDDGLWLPYNFLSRLPVSARLVDGELVEVKVAWARNARRIFSGPLGPRHSKFAGAVFPARTGREEAVRAARSALAQGMAGGAFERIMDAACSVWGFSPPTPSPSELPVLALPPGALGPGYSGALSFPNEWEDAKYEFYYLSEVFTDPAGVMEGDALLGPGDGWVVEIPMMTVRGAPSDVALFRRRCAEALSKSGMDPRTMFPSFRWNPALTMLADTGAMVVSASGVSWPELFKVAAMTAPHGRLLVFTVSGEASLAVPAGFTVSGEASVDAAALMDTPLVRASGQARRRVSF